MKIEQFHLEEELDQVCTLQEDAGLKEPAKLVKDSDLPLSQDSDRMICCLWPIRPAGEIYNAKGLTLLIACLIGSVDRSNGLYATDKMQVLCTHKQKRHCR